MKRERDKHIEFNEMRPSQEQGALDNVNELSCELNNHTIEAKEHKSLRAK